MSINHDLESTSLTQRIGLVVFLKNSSDQYKLRKYGDIVYFSKKMCYCVLYVDASEAEIERTEISSLDFVKKVELSEGEKVDLSSLHIEKQISDLAQKAEDQLLQAQKKSEDEV